MSKYIIVNTYVDMGPDTATTFIGRAATLKGVKRVIEADRRKGNYYFYSGDYDIYERVGSADEVLKDKNDT